MHESIFKAYDIRGIWLKDFDEGDVFLIAKAIIDVLNPKRVIIGRDARIGSREIKEIITKTLVHEGIKVFDIGLTTTDALCYGTTIKEISADIGIMVTASHNPKQYNGIKIVKEYANPIKSEELIKIKIRAKELEAKELQNIKHILRSLDEKLNQDLIIKYDILPKFCDALTKIIPSHNIQNIKLIVDTSNGSAGQIVKEVLSNYDIDYDIINFEPDGSFPNHDPDPTKEENLEEIKLKLMAKNYDIGLAFDGDGDRVVILDEKGNKINGSIIGAIIAEHMLNQNPKSKKVLYNVVCSWIVPETIKKNGGIAIVTPVGQITIKKIFKEENALLAIETSGHYNFSQLYAIDSGILAALYMLKVLSLEKKNGKRLSDLVRRYKKYYASPEINFKATTREKIREVIDTLKHMYSDGKQITIDGLRVEYPNIWFSVRASNTEPLIRLNVEAKDPDLLERRTKELVGVIERLIKYN